MRHLDFSKDNLLLSDRKRLEEMYQYVRDQSSTFVGYPCRGDLDFTPLLPFLEYPINNVGDPFAESTYRIHTRQIEREVLAWFADLTHISRSVLGLRHQWWNGRQPVRAFSCSGAVPQCSGVLL